METYLGYKLEKRETPQSGPDGKSTGTYIAWAFSSPDGSFTGERLSRDKARLAIKVHKEFGITTPVHSYEQAKKMYDEMALALFDKPFARSIPQGEEVHQQIEQAYVEGVKVEHPAVEIRKVVQRPKQELIFIQFHGWWASGYETTKDGTHTMRVLTANHSPYKVGDYVTFEDSDRLTQAQVEEMQMESRKRRRQRRGLQSLHSPRV